MRKLFLDFVPGLIGAVVGGLVGYYGVYLIRMQGFYAPVLPGALAGLGCGMLSRTNSNVRGVFVALIAAVAGFVTEWLVFFLPREKSLDNFVGFLKQMPDEPMITKVLLGLGVVLGFWWGRECSFRSRLIPPEPKPKPVDPE